MKKHDYTDLMIALGTVIVLNVLLPIFDGISNMAISAMNKTINKWQLDMQLDQAEAEAASEVISPAPAITQAIGFSIPSEEDYDDYDDE